eukprot:2701897-Pyramimonas_sp.AAC.1
MTNAFITEDKIHETCWRACQTARSDIPCSICMSSGHIVACAEARRISSPREIEMESSRGLARASLAKAECQD